MTRRRLKLSTLIAREMWTEVLDRISSHPTEVETWDNSYLPIHRACRYASVPIKVIEALVEAYPQSVELKAKSCDRIALHCTTCLFSATNADVVEILLRRYREGASVRDVHGQTPLIYHLRQSPVPSLEVVEMLVESYPDTVWTGDNDNCYPLHCAARRGELDISQYLIDMYPDALLEKNTHGQTPHDVAQKNGKHQLRDVLLQEEEKRFGRHDGMSPLLSTDDEDDKVDDEEAEEEIGQQPQQQGSRHPNHEDPAHHHHHQNDENNPPKTSSIHEMKKCFKDISIGGMPATTMWKKTTISGV